MRDKAKEYTAALNFILSTDEEIKREIEKAFRAGIAAGVAQATTIRPKEEIEIER